VDYVTTEYHDGLAYTVKIDALKTPKCVKCGQVAPDSEALDAITAVFLRQINLLTPEQIEEHRLKAKLTQHELAAALGIADWEVEKLESGGMIQPRTLDNLMRLCFGKPEVREILTTQQISTLPDAPVHATP
jgi:DNA-binding transcriptional regulator YiaG